ncbi:Early nodulin-like protein 3 [Morella rubra]|uniref:Early nodulin-like protein 3 n=1 Tax=Morella rubra TaxID=262757 RepID=A0A6A1VTI8_9ROSI|nr:Early nodulin-like protein 3 [Morella rubra]
MANNIFPSKTLYAVGLFCLMLLLQKGGATEFKIGGSKGWTVPTDPSEVHYNQWAENNRFQIGDSLAFDYPADQDSVLHVSQDDYTNCNTEAPIEKFSDGHTVYQLKQSGPYYFISGNRDNCLKNEKFVLVVLADRSNSSSNTNQTSTVSPPPPPASTPSPAPAGESPPAGTVNINPTPAPVSEPPPPPSEASSILIYFHQFPWSIHCFISFFLTLKMDMFA